MPSALWAQKMVPPSEEGEEYVPLPAAPAPALHAPTAMPAGSPPPNQADSAPAVVADQPPQPAAVSKKEEDPLPFNMVLLQGINKSTARISPIEAPLGEVVRFGNLEIIARSCWQAPPEAQPENAAFLEIWELKPGEGPARIFMGWMFSSSPALSSLEHAVYDMTVLQCRRLEIKEE